MIHRQNWLDVRDYLHYMGHARQVKPETVKRSRSHLRHLLEWADDTPFPHARSIDPAFPSYLLRARADGQKKTLAPASIADSLENARQFFTFARAEWPHLYKPISESWIALLQPPRAVRAESRLVIREIFPFEDVLTVAAVAAETLHDRRAQAAVCLLFLSGMRADALASLPIACVDLPARSIHQLPEQGVRTKNDKAAITYLLEIPALFNVVSRWDCLVRDTLPAGSLWYSNLSRDGLRFNPKASSISRVQVVEDDTRRICALANLPYRSPHKLRHGHVVWALKQARDLEDLKSISQNIMHASVVITDGIYGKLVRDDVQNTIARLGQSQTGNETLEAKIDRLLAILQPTA